MLDYFLLFLAGLAGGFLAGLLGLGGGIMYLLILPFALTNAGIPQEYLPQFVIANSIFGIFFASSAGSFELFRTKQFYWKKILPVALSSTLVAIIFLITVVNTSWYSKEKFSAAVIFILLLILFNALRKKNNAGSAKSKESIPLFLITGFCGGAVASFTGLGGGTVMVPLLVALNKFQIKTARAISLGVITLMSLAMTLFNLFENVSNFTEHQYGFIILGVAIPLSIGVILASPFGVYIGNRLSNKVITIVFVVFIFLLMIKKISELF